MLQSNAASTCHESTQTACVRLYKLKPSNPVLQIKRQATPKIVPGQREAAVALVLQPQVSGLRALFILRAKKEGDPWSGQMALPGGHREAIDADLVETARRETQEEIGLDLNQAGRYLGRFDGHSGEPASGL